MLGDGTGGSAGVGAEESVVGRECSSTPGAALSIHCCLIYFLPISICEVIPDMTENEMIMKQR